MRIPIPIAALPFPFLILISVAQAASPFPDTRDSSYDEAVGALAARSVVQGYPDGSFKPKQPVNRAEFLKMVMKGKGGLEPPRRSCFRDVRRLHWFAPYVCAAKNRGVVEGYQDRKFHPERTVNFAEALKMMLGAYGREIVPPPRGEWYEGYITFADRNGIILRESYLPWQEVTRERMADMVWRMLRFDEGNPAPHTSPGCGKDPPSPPLSTVRLDGGEQNFLLTVPDAYTPEDPRPLIVAIHGRTNSAEKVREYYELDRFGDEELIAYPRGIGTGPYSWTNGDGNGERIWVVRLFDEIVRAIGEQYCVDLDRVFTVGHSLGAWAANTVACVRGDVVRASGTVGGAMSFSDCAAPSAAMLLHNPNDRLAPFESGVRTRDHRLKQNACKGETQTVQPLGLGCVRYTDCHDPNPVVWCPHEVNIDWQGEYYPHQWPNETGKHFLKFFRSLE